MSNTTLIVPVNVSALCVGTADATGDKSTWPQADFTLLPSTQQAPYISAAVLERSTPLGAQANFAGAGVHLQWALPAAIAQGEQGESSIVFPAAPNRWLVSRILVNISDPTNPVTTVTSWVVAGDVLNDTLPPLSPYSANPGQHCTVPNASPAKQQNYQFLGQTFELASWAEPGGAALTPFTASGYGEPAFSGFYPDCSTVFGYYDSFSDVEDYTPSDYVTSYRVSGWYSDASVDPMNPANLPGGLPATSSGNPMEWDFTNGNTPESTVCSGFVENITWDPGTTYLSQSANTLQVAIGPSGPEAIASMLANQAEPGDVQATETLINAFQFGLETRNGDAPNRIQKLEETVHSAGFTALNAGSIWTITAVTEGTPYPTGTATALDTLNTAQKNLNALLSQQMNMQAQLFSDWYEYLVVTYESSELPSSVQSLLNSNNVSAYITGELNAYNTFVQTTLADAGTAVSTALSDLQNLLGDAFTVTNDKNESRYYAPSDPVLALSGQDVMGVDRTGLAADGSLACRLDGEIVSQLTLDAGFVASSVSTTVAGSSLPGLGVTMNDGPADLLEQLVQETFFLAPSLQPVVAAATAGTSGGPGQVDFTTTVTNLQTNIPLFMQGTTLSNASMTNVETGGAALPPQPIAAVTMPSNGAPWMPLLLQYNVQMQPVAALNTAQDTSATYPVDFFSNAANFTFNSDSIDYEYTNSAPTIEGYPVTAATFLGTLILTGGATASLEGAFENFLNNGGVNSEVSQLLSDLQAVPQLAQAVSGFAQTMIMQEQTLQLPVADPFAAEAINLHFINPLATAIATVNNSSPVPNLLFNPIRSGAFSIVALRVIDVFGRYLDYTTDTKDAGAVTPYIATAFAPPASLSTPLPAGTAFLPPRFVQPARLHFRWIPASADATESSQVDGTSPVFGWIVPDLLGHGIFIYDASGVAMGELELNAAQNGVVWTAAPGGPNPPDTPIDTVFADAHPDLVAFVKAANNVDYLLPFLSAVMESLSWSVSRNPEADAVQMLLLGNPLGLANAQLMLQQQGLPAMDTSYQGLAAAVGDNNTPPRTNGGVQQVKIPVLLGDLMQLDDGLIGYWNRSGTTTNYTNFYTEAVNANTNGIQPPPYDNILLTLGDTAPTPVTVLFDPRGQIHATTGILPVKAIDLPKQHYLPALENMQATFLTSPVLSGPQGGLALPLPGNETGVWTWIQAAGSSWAAPVTPVAATALAGLQPLPQQILDGWLRTAVDRDGGDN